MYGGSDIFARLFEMRLPVYDENEYLMKPTTFFCFLLGVIRFKDFLIDSKTIIKVFKQYMKFAKVTIKDDRTLQLKSFWCFDYRYYKICDALCYLY